MARILVIDDEDVLRNSLCDVLTFEGFDVAGASDGGTGIALAHDFLPDLVICDLAMPQMDGFSTLSALRGDAATAHIPVIMLTARADPISRQRGESLGVDAYVTKPFTIDEILAVVQEHLLNR